MSQKLQTASARSSSRPVHRLHPEKRQKTEGRLQELQTELVHISRLTAMGEMASALAHELNQPLSAIANYMKGSRRLLEGRAYFDAMHSIGESPIVEL